MSEEKLENDRRLPVYRWYRADMSVEEKLDQLLRYVQELHEGQEKLTEKILITQQKLIEEGIL